MDEIVTVPSETSPRRISPIVVIFLLSGVMGIIAAAAMLFAEKPLESVRGQRSAPTFETATLDGDSVKLADFRGRPVFLNFWRTDCPPCVNELPAFQQFINEQADTGAVVLAVNQGEETDDITAFLDELGITNLTVLLDVDYEITDSYGPGGLPTTYIIDENGVLRYLKIGELTLEEMYRYLDAIAEDSAAAKMQN